MDLSQISIEHSKYSNQIRISTKPTLKQNINSRYLNALISRPAFWVGLILLERFF